MRLRSLMHGCLQVPLADLCTHCDIWADFAGSDHAPVVADLALPSLVPPGRPPPPLPLSSRVRWNLSGKAINIHINSRSIDLRPHC